MSLYASKIMGFLQPYGGLPHSAPDTIARMRTLPASLLLSQLEAVGADIERFNVHIGCSVDRSRPTLDMYCLIPRQHG